MKKSALAVLAAVFALSLASCGNTAADEQTLAETVQITLAETAAEITEAETTTTTAETTSETTEATTTVTETEKVCACESDFQHACCEYLNGHIPVGGVYFGDINGDGTPEAVVETNPYESTDVLYENENGMQVLKLKTVAYRGHVAYIADTKQILFNPQRNSGRHIWGYEEYHIYSWNGTDYEETSSVYREPGIYYGDGAEYPKFGQAYIDGKEVDNDTFEVKLAEFEKLGNETDYFPVVRFLNAENEEIFESYMKENFPCFDNWYAFPVKEE